MLANQITPEMIEECQNLIDTSREGFFDDVAPIVATLKQIASSEANLTNQNNVKAMCNAAAEIKSNAGLFGYDLIAALAGQMFTLINSRKYDQSKKVKLAQKYIEALIMAINQKINDSGGAVGELILKDLAAAAKAAVNK